MALDRTREDISQDERIAKLEARLSVLEEKSGLHAASITTHGKLLHELDPLRGLIEFAESIKAQFANFRLK